MPPHFGPAPPRLDQDSAVEFQSSRGCSSNGRFPSNSSTFLYPPEMLEPHVLTRVKKRNQGLGYGVECGDARTLRQIAVPASKAKIFRVVCTTQDFGKDMINCETHTQNSFLTLAVSAAKPKLRRYFAAQLESQLGFGHP